MVALTATSGGSTLDVRSIRYHVNVTGMWTSSSTLHVRLTACPAFTVTEEGLAVTLTGGTRMKDIGPCFEIILRENLLCRVEPSPASRLLLEKYLYEEILNVRIKTSIKFSIRKCHSNLSVSLSLHERFSPSEFSELYHMVPNCDAILPQSRGRYSSCSCGNC